MTDTVTSQLANVTLEEVPLKKRRGRKPKDQTPVVTDPPVETDTPKVKGKRGRKPKHVYTAYDTSITETSLNSPTLSDDENVIVRLNISESDITDLSATVVDDNHPYAYNHDTYRNLSNVTYSNNDDIHNTLLDEPSTPVSKNGVKVVNILKDFEEKNKNNEWPLNTSICCYWCCHRFDNAPYGIPINYVNETFQVYGCFCSLECAAAYNFSETKNHDEMWERYQLINFFSRKTGQKNVVKPAPSRLSLKMFGGHMDIETFREFNVLNKFINVNFPPMTSVTQQLEEINDFELGNDFKYIPVDNERINKYKEKIVFKRNKPLIDTNKSLESTMNLKYS